MWWIILVVSLSVVFVWLGKAASSPLTILQLEAKVRRLVRRHGSKTTLTGASVGIYSESQSLDLILRHDERQPEAFHAASVGKLFTAVMIGKLVDEGLLTFDSNVASILPPDTLAGLFETNGVDHQNEVTVSQLLSHTSGVADYFGDEPAADESVARLMAKEPKRSWNPMSLIEFTRVNLNCVGAPGEHYHYSDTGFVILGLVVESLTRAPFEQSVHESIFQPLGMRRTFFPGRTRPEAGSAELRSVWLEGRDLRDAESLTADWAGGGVASTERDLLTFSTGLHSGTLLSDTTYRHLCLFDWRFRRGMGYGHGMMEYRFGEFTPLLRGYPGMIGHMGILGTQLFYSPELDLHIVINLGSSDAAEKSARLLIAVYGLALRLPRQTDVEREDRFAP